MSELKVVGVAIFGAEEGMEFEYCEPKTMMRMTGTAGARILANESLAADPATGKLRPVQARQVLEFIR